MNIVHWDGSGECDWRLERLLNIDKSLQLISLRHLREEKDEIVRLKASR